MQKYRHERLVSPKTLAKYGLMKYRSVRTPGGSLLRIAYPPGRRRKGSGEVQAILHRKNPPLYLSDFLAAYPKTLVKREGNSIKVFPRDMDNRGLWDLFHLKDYRVSSALSGAGYALIPVLKNSSVRIPGLSKWAMYAGGTSGGGKHAYSFTTGPWPSRRYHIDPFTYENGHFRGYVLQVMPGKYGLWETIGTFRDPNKAVAKTSEYEALANPLTKQESENLTAEAIVHSRIKGGNKEKTAYYQGMAEGMMDAVKQYSALQKRGLTPAGDTGREALTLMKHIQMLNPPGHMVQIYAEVKEIIAVKGPGHVCSAACRRAAHTYRHRFTSKAGVYGNPKDQSYLLIK